MREQINRREPLWVVILLGLLVIAIATISRAGDFPGRAGRSDRFNASGEIHSLSLENVSGEVQVTAGVSFSATVEIAVHADSDRRAREVLDKVRAHFENENGSLYLSTLEPGSEISRDGRRWRVHVHQDDSRYRIESRYAVTLPPEAALSVTNINGNVSASGIHGALDLSSVNGRVEISGARQAVKVSTVNGNISAAISDFARAGQIESQTVNGNITLRLPSHAGFHLSAQSMTGDIVSTFPLPVAANSDRHAREEAEREREKLREERDRLRAEKERVRRESGDKGDLDLDMSELDRSMEELGEELGRSATEMAEGIVESLHRHYDGSINGGGTEVKCTTLNGRIAILDEKSAEREARTLLPRRGGFSLTAPTPPTPPTQPAPPAPPMPPMPPNPGRAPRAPGMDDEGSIERGDINGNFEVTLPFGDVRLGRVSGNVRIETHGGEIHIVEAGKGATLASNGGEVKIETSRGDLRCLTHGGDINVGEVTGNARLETAGGDIVLHSCTGSVSARSGGGDIRLDRVRGGVHAWSGGGSLSCAITGRETDSGVELSTGAGDITLTLPANFRADVSVRVTGVDPEEDYIVSEFPEIAVVKRASGMSQTGSGRLNGGGPRLILRASSGTVTIKKGPPA